MHSSVRVGGEATRLPTLIRLEHPTRYQLQVASYPLRATHLSARTRDITYPLHFDVSPLGDSKLRVLTHFWRMKG